jgi:hypothetical protein
MDCIRRFGSGTLLQAVERTDANDTLVSTQIDSTVTSQNCRPLSLRKQYIPLIILEFKYVEL